MLRSTNLILTLFLTALATAYAASSRNGGADEPMVDIPVLGLVFTQRCFDVFLTNGLLSGSLDIFDMDCIRITLSKGLGWGIVIFSGLLKAPQIYKIVAAGDVSGISASAFYFDAFGYLITPVYGYLEGFPFSTYGESFPIGIQNFVLVLLFWYYAKGAEAPGVGEKLLISASAAGMLAGMCTMPAAYRSWLPLISTVANLYSRMPQIYTNFTNGHTGQLAVGTWVMATVGLVARVFTTWSDVDDPIFLVSQCTAFLASAIILTQIVTMREATAKALSSSSGTKSEVRVRRSSRKKAD